MAKATNTTKLKTLVAWEEKDLLLVDRAIRTDNIIFLGGDIFCNPLIINMHRWILG